MRPRLLTAHQVADLFGLKRRQFMARRRRMEAQHGFPPPVAGLPDRWDPAAIEAWLRAQRPPEAAATTDAAEQLLLDRARAMQAGLDAEARQ